MRAHPVPGCTVMGIRPGREPALDVHAFTPIVTLQWAVQGKANALNPGKRGELPLKPLVESRQTLRLVTRPCRIEMNYIAIRRFNAEVLMLQIEQSAGEQSGAYKKHQRKRSLKDDQGFLRQRGAIRSGTVEAMQGLCRIRM